MKHVDALPDGISKSIHVPHRTDIISPEISGVDGHRARGVDERLNLSKHCSRVCSAVGACFKERKSEKC